MSSILKSLRKIEEEKRGAVHAAPDLRVDQGFVPVKPKRLLPLLTGLALGAVIVGLFFLWPSRSTLPNVKDQLPAVVKYQSETKANQVVSTVKQDQKASVARQEERVVAPVKEEQTPVVAKVISNPVSTIQISPVAMMATPEVPAELPEDVSLLVTEIFFQEDSASSMAVVNDLPVMIGTRVDSAIVTEIHPDRVIFKVGDKIYVVYGANMSRGLSDKP